MTNAERDVVELAAKLVDLMAYEINDAPVSAAWNDLRIALLPHRSALTASQEPLRALEEHRDELNRLKDLYGTALISHIIAALNTGTDHA